MAIVLADDSFKKPAVPFKWETRPGVSKFQEHHNPEPPPSLLSSSSSSFSLGSTSSTTLAPSKELQTQWVQSMSHSSSSKNRPSASLARIGQFSGHCFPISWSWWTKWRNERKLAKPKLKLKLELDPEYINKDNTLYLEKLARWSMSSSWRASSSSFSSHIQRSSPDQSTFSNDDEAALFRLYSSMLGFLRRQKTVGTERKGKEKKEISISIYVVDTKE